MLVISILLLSVFFNLMGLVLAFYLFRFARIILSFEDTLEETNDAIDNLEESVEGLTQVKMFFESKEIHAAMKVVVDNIKLARMSLMKTTEALTRFSKQKYTMVRLNEEKEQEAHEEQGF